MLAASQALGVKGQLSRNHSDFALRRLLCIVVRGFVVAVLYLHFPLIIHCSLERFMPMIVNSVAYRKGLRVGDITLEDISEVIKAPDTFVWLGLHEPDLPLLLKMQEEFSLHDLAIEDARNAHQRPKVEQYGDSLFLALKTAQLQNGHVAYGETHLFVGKHFLVSVRHGPSSSHIGVRERCEKSPRMLSKGPGFALYALLDFVVDNYQPIVNQFEKNFDTIEANLFKGQFDKNAMERLYELKRQLLQLRTIILPVEDICNEFMRFHEEIVSKELRVYYRDIQDHVTRLISAIDSLREMVSAAMQVNLALVAVRQNEVVKSLAGWGAILAIPTVIFSLYGMNFEVMPELKWAGSYPTTLVVTAVGCFLLHRKLKRSGWV